MALKIGSWLIGIGCFLGAAGLCFLPAAFGLHPDNAMLSAGAMVFSLGMVLAAVGFYAKARHWGTEGRPATAKPAHRPAKKIKCDLCGLDGAVIQCRVHRLQLCSDCIGEHYDFRSCAYVPTVRPGTAKAKAQGQGHN